MATGAGPEPEEARWSNSHGSASQHPTRRLGKEPLRHIRERLDDASKKQEDLAQSREELILQRQRVRTYGKQVRDQRIETGNAEISFMNQLRQYCNEHGLKFPFHLDATYQTVQKERDKLGAIEAEYLQAERVLGGTEFTYMDAEKEFYQYELFDMFADDVLENLSDDAAAAESEVHVQPQPPSHDPTPDFPPSNIVTDYQAAVSKKEQLRKEFEVLRMQQSHNIQLSKRSTASIRRAMSEPQQDPEFVKKCDILLTNMARTEVQVQQLKQEVYQIEDSKFEAIQRRFSDPIHGAQEPVLQSDTIRRAHTETAISSLRDKFTDPKARVRGWIWEHLSNSGLEQTYYKNILNTHVEHPDGKGHIWWEDQASQYWDYDDDNLLNSPDERPHDPSITCYTTHYTSQRSNIDPATGSNVVEHSPLQETHSNGKRVTFSMNFEDKFNYVPIPSVESMDSLEPVEPSDLPRGIVPSQQIPPPPLFENAPFNPPTRIADNDPSSPDNQDLNVQKFALPTNRFFKFSDSNNSHSSTPPTFSHPLPKGEEENTSTQNVLSSLQPSPLLDRRRSTTNSNDHVHGPSGSITPCSDLGESVILKPCNTSEYTSNETQSALYLHNPSQTRSSGNDPPPSPIITLSPSTTQYQPQDSTMQCPILPNIKPNISQMLARMSSLAPSSALTAPRPKSERGVRGRSIEPLPHRRTSSSSGSLSIHDISNHGTDSNRRVVQSTERRQQLLKLADQLQRHLKLDC